jgi:hypothetical protein
VPRRPRRAVARVVDEDVDPAQRCGRGIDRPSRGCHVGDVEGDRPDPLALVVEDPGAGPHVAHSRQNGCPGSREGAGQLHAQAARRAGDERDLSGEVEGMGHG